MFDKCNDRPICKTHPECPAECSGIEYLKEQMRIQVEEMTMLEFPNLCKLSEDEMRNIQHLAMEAKAFDNKILEELEKPAPLRCSQCGYEQLTCMRCGSRDTLHR